MNDLEAPAIEEILSHDISFGSESLSISVSKLHVEFRGLDAGLLTTGSALFRNFLRPDSPSPVDALILETVSTDRTQFLSTESVRPLVDPPFRTVRDAGRLLFWSHDFACLVDEETRRGRLVLCKTEPDVYAMNLSNCVRLLFAFNAVEYGSFLLHAAGLALRDKVHVFFGTSGAGKSTVASLSTDTLLLGDDQVLISPHRGDVSGEGTPFMGGERLHAMLHGGTAPNENLRLPVAGFYRLIKSESVAIVPLSMTEAIPALLSVTSFLSEPSFGIK
ncbi:hypothetical protein ACFL4G_06380, partial [Thermodesulfobacteriota bacterium]